MTPTVLNHFAMLPDPRVDRTKRHTLGDMVAIAVCAVVCGADSWTEVEQFGKAKEGWFTTFLNLPHGIPSHDTFGRVFSAINPEAFEGCFLKWTAALTRSSGGQLIAIDGKTLRRSFRSADRKASIHMISAWCEVNHLVLGQLATEAKSNEITAIPKLLKLLDLTDAIVTIDAMGCQKAIAQQIVDQGGDYVLGLKGNQGTLHRRVERLFDEALTGGWAGVRYGYHETIEKDHGRIETRRLWCTDQIDWVRACHRWPGLRSLICVDSQRAIDGRTSTERRYYISSLDSRCPRLLADAIRGHWGIENRLHWSLDISFREDESRIRQRHGAENFSRLRRIALNLLKQDRSTKIGIKAKRLKAGWDENYLLNVLTHPI